MADRAKVKAKVHEAAKVVGAFAVTMLKNPVVFNTPEFDRRRRRQASK